MSDLISASLRLVVEPLTFPFMQRALFATLIVAVACAVVGAFVVSKGLAFIGDALAHASFAGIALALLLRRSIYFGAAAAAVAMSLAITLVYRELVVVAFDPVMAEAAGIPVDLLRYVLLGLIGLTVMAAVKALGIVLVVAMLVTPAATAGMLTHRFQGIMLLGAALSAVAAVVGLYVAFYANVASGASTVLVSTLMFLAVLLAPARRSAGSGLPSVR